MKAQKLRNAVLLFAVQGKLVPQDPTDEPASILLEKINAEKELLIKDKQIKSEKHLTEITDDEKPFDIPESWKWVRLGDIGSWGSGATPSRTKPQYYNGTIPWLKTGDLNDGYITEIPENITDLALKETSVRINPIGSVLMAMYGATIGKAGILAIEATTNQACCACLPFTLIYNKYIFYFLLSQREELKKRSEGGAQPNISKEKIITYQFPLPSLAEQHRIVAKIEEIMPKIDEYEKLEQELSALEKRYPNDLKKSILQYAVQGKLVPQSSADEPASVLLEKIKAEKKQIIKENKIKRDNPFPAITDDEKPFDIPDNWEWARLIDCCLEIADVDHKMPTVNSDGVPYISPVDFRGDSKIDFENAKKISFKDFERLSRKVKPEKHDIIFPRYGTIGILRYIDVDFDFLVSYSCATIKTSKVNSIPKFIYYALQSSQTKKEIDKYINKTTQPNVGLQSIKQFIFPLPPIAEQRRIVAKIEELMNLCDILADEKALTNYKFKVIENKVIPFPAPYFSEQEEDFAQAVGFRSNDDKVDADDLKEIFNVANKYTK